MAIFLFFVHECVRVAYKKPVFSVMDMMLAALAFALLAVAAWMLYKRYTARFKSTAAPVVDMEEEDEVEEAPAVQEASAEAPDPKKEA